MYVLLKILHSSGLIKTLLENPTNETVRGQEANDTGPNSHKNIRKETT
jgi:hypothetical protein